MFQFSKFILSVALISPLLFTESSAARTLVSPFSNEYSTGTKKKADLPNLKTWQEIPPEADLQKMIKQSLLDFNDAIQKEDFDDFRLKSSTFFQGQFDNASCKEVFGSFIRQKEAVGKVFEEFKKLKAKHSTTPEIQSVKGYQVLRLIGAYATAVSFTYDLKYVFQKNQWKLLKIEVHLESTP